MRSKRHPTLRLASEESAPQSALGGCFACGLGATAALGGSDKRYSDLVLDEAWEAVRPNPLPMFARPDGLYTPLFLPGLYLPLPVPPRHWTQRGIPYYPLPHQDVSDFLQVFLHHENVHQLLLQGLIPSLTRLIAARCYLQQILMSRIPFTPEVWNGFQANNALIQHLFIATGPIHEAVANAIPRFAETANTTPLRHDLARLSIESYANSYSHDERYQVRPEENFSYGAKLLIAYAMLERIITDLAEHFSFIGLYESTILSLAEYAISSSVEKEDIRSDIFDGPGPLSDDIIRSTLFAPFGIPTTKGLATIPLAPKLYHITDATDKFTYELIPLVVKFIEAKVPPPQYRVLKLANGEPAPPEMQHSQEEADQLIHLAEQLPDFHEWLRQGAELHWLRQRVWDATRDVETHLANAGWPLPLSEAWGPKFGAHILLRGAGKFVSLGRRSDPSSFMQFEGIPDDQWLAYARQADAAVGIVFGPLCIGTDRLAALRPMPFFLGQGDSPEGQEMCNRLSLLVLFEGLRQQMAIGEGVSCPLRCYF